MNCRVLWWFLHKKVMSETKSTRRRKYIVLAVRLIASRRFTTWLTLWLPQLCTVRRIVEWSTSDLSESVAADSPLAAVFLYFRYLENWTVPLWQHQLSCVIRWATHTRWNNSSLLWYQISNFIRLDVYSKVKIVKKYIIYLFRLNV